MRKCLSDDAVAWIRFYNSTNTKNDGKTYTQREGREWKGVEEIENEFTASTKFEARSKLLFRERKMGISVFFSILCFLVFDTANVRLLRAWLIDAIFPLIFVGIVCCCCFILSSIFPTEAEKYTWSLFRSSGVCTEENRMIFFIIR